MFSAIAGTQHPALRRIPDHTRQGVRGNKDGPCAKWTWTVEKNRRGQGLVEGDRDCAEADPRAATLRGGWSPHRALLTTDDV